MLRAVRLAAAFLLAAGAVLPVAAQEVRFRAGSAAFPADWTAIPSSRPGQDNAAGYLLSGLTAETAYDFELRAVDGDSPGMAASASATTLPPFTARFSPLKTYYEGTQFTMTIVFTAAIAKEVLDRGVVVQGGRLGGVRAEPGQPEKWHLTASGTRRRDVTFILFAATGCDTLGFYDLCSTLGEPLTAELRGPVPHRPSVTLALSPATIFEGSGVTTVTASLDKTWHEDVTVEVSASPVTPATASFAEFHDDAHDRDGRHAEHRHRDGHGGEQRHAGGGQAGDRIRRGDRAGLRPRSGRRHPDHPRRRRRALHRRVQPHSGDPRRADGGSRCAFGSAPTSLPPRRWRTAWS